MKKIFLFSTLLIAGLVGSQVLPVFLGDLQDIYVKIITFFTMTGLAFIMIHVGYEFDLDKKNLHGFGYDYLVAMTTATFPWIIATAYFIYVLMPPMDWGSWDAWKEALLIGRFAAPTATGVLFAMLAAAGLSATWMFRKTRILAIFDDLDTVLLMIPLKIMMIGLAWQLGVVVVIMALLLWISWRWLHKVNLPTTWTAVLFFSVIIAGASEILYFATKIIDHRVPIHLEVLLPAFVLGTIMKRPSDPHVDDAREGHQEGPESPEEQKVSTIVSAVFMLLVGLSMPQIAASGEMSWVELAGHVAVVTVLINVGKMFPAFVYRKEANWRERLAVALGMCPRGEVGAGIILLSLTYGISGPMVNIAILSLVLNLILTPVFIWVIVRLMEKARHESKNDEFQLST